MPFPYRNERRVWLASATLATIFFVTDCASIKSLSRKALQLDSTAGDADRMEEGESLVIYTDGLTDAMDPSDALFGEERLTTLLQSHHGADPSEILNQVEEALNQYTAPGRPADDINIIVLQRPAK